MKKIIRLYHTLKYLKKKQFIYRFYYISRNIARKAIKHKYIESISAVSFSLKLQKSIKYKKLFKDNTFTFIGLTHKFEKQNIDWNYISYGKLWNYNLTYFDFLEQKEMSQEDGLYLINDFIYYAKPIIGKKMPYPISLRNINFIKFLSQLSIQDKKIDSFIFAQYRVLMDNIEYHLLGNHLLENGFSLLFGAYYFRDEQLYTKAYTILKEELDEQILDDGAHFELTPMYHQIILFRVLDCINLVKNNEWKNQELLLLLTKKAELMLGWLKIITYKTGEIPLFNDSTNGIAPNTKELILYAENLNIEASQVTLSQSGYRKEANEYYESIIDVGNIGPDYIPGHAHSDTFNFELYIKEQPVIVDAGLSTYEINKIRTLERSTSSHNTVEIDGENQTEVWSGFRVAQRAKIIKLIEEENMIEAMHDGYKKRGYLHNRKWIYSDKRIEIIDSIHGKTPKEAINYLHFHPNIDVEIKNNSIITSSIIINCINITTLSIKEYNYSNNFNYKEISLVVEIKFKQNMSLEINII